MRRISFITAVLFLAACTGTIDPEDTGNPGNTDGSTDTENPGDQPGVVPDAFTEPFTLSVDKDEVEADGVDCVVFSLKDAYDREMLTDMRTLEKVNITSSDGIRVPRMKTSTSFIANGTYSFTASYQGKKSNAVEVTAKNRAKYEVFHRNVGLFKCTSVWCSACPGLGRSLHGLSGDAAEHSVVIAVHGNFQKETYGADPFSLYVGDMDLGSYMLGRFGGQGWPTLIYDLATAETSAAPTSDIVSNIMERRVASPATCGFKVTSVALDGTSLKIAATMKTSTGGDYDLACAVLRNGLVADGFSINNDGVYDEVLVAMSESGIGYYQGVNLAADEEYSEVFSFDFGSKVPTASELDDFYVAVYAHRKTEHGSVMDNIVTCAYGETVDYHLND